MRYVNKIFIWMGLWLVFGALAAAPVALADEAVTVKEAHRAVHSAQRAVERAKARLSEARAIESATRKYSASYGATVGRWVWLSNDVGWPRSQWGMLFYVVNRESGGNPSAKNPTSTASGLLQFLSSWWEGKWDPFNPRQNLRHGYMAWREVGWQPWAL